MNALPHPDDDRRVRELLGREPRGRYDVVVRDDAGDPVVLRNAPLLDDGTPMPTRYWLVGPREVRRIGRLEAAGGVAAAEAAVDPAELAAAHAHYAAERDAELPTGYDGPRPTGGVGGTRVGVKCLHAHWAWHLAGGDDPVGRWIAARLAGEEGTGDTHPAGQTRPAGTVRVRVDAAATTIELADGATATVPWGPTTLTERLLGDADPPRPESLTNVLGTVTDHLDDVVRAHPELLDTAEVAFAGPPIRALAGLELGHDLGAEPVELRRADAEEIFRIVATEPAHDRAHNPGLPLADVDEIVATCCTVLAVMRRLHLAHVVLLP